MNALEINVLQGLLFVCIFMTALVSPSSINFASPGDEDDGDDDDEDDDNDSTFPDTSDVKTNFYNATVEKKFKELHPDLDKLEPWPMAENMTEEFLKHICINILLDVYPSFVPTIRFVREYVPSEPGELHTKRVMRKSPVEFKEGIKNMTLLRCVFQDFQFFVARGDSEYVFKIEKDPKSDAYFFMSGPHAINFKEEI